MVGWPKQIRKVYEGVDVIKEGKRISRTGKIDIEGVTEAGRALLRGQYGPRAVKEHYKDTALKKRLHKRIAKIFYTTKNKSLLAKLPDMTKKPFWGDDGDAFMRHAKALGFNDFKTIQTLMKRAEKEEIELNPTSILYYIKDRLKE